jgi:catechol 2,3-dioxygenase-like lactoylglutathione lyase family enzyme
LAAITMLTRVPLRHAPWISATALAAAVGLGVSATPLGGREGSRITGACHVSPVVADLDRSARFYRDVLGFEISPALPPSGALPKDTNADQPRMHGTPGAAVRSAQARVPTQRCGIELIEFGGIGRTGVRRRIQDHGAITMILIVRDLDALFARIAQAGARVVTTGGRPISIGGTRVVTIEDPDGHFVELAQLARTPETTSPESSNVIAIRLRVAVDDLARAVGFYRDALGLTFKTDDFVKNEGAMQMLGLATTGEYRVSTVTLPASPLIFEIIEYRGVAASQHHHVRVQDPGAYRLQLTVDNMDTTVLAMKTAGAPILSAGGAPIDMTIGGRRWRRAAVEDPENIFLILEQPPQ